MVSFDWTRWPSEAILASDWSISKLNSSETTGANVLKLNMFIDSADLYKWYTFGATQVAHWATEAAQSCHWNRIWKTQFASEKRFFCTERAYTTKEFKACGEWSAVRGFSSGLIFFQELTEDGFHDGEYLDQEISRFCFLRLVQVTFQFTSC